MCLGEGTERFAMHSLNVGIYKEANSPAVGSLPFDDWLSVPHDDPLEVQAWMCVPNCLSTNARYSIELDSVLKHRS